MSEYDIVGKTGDLKQKISKYYDNEFNDNYDKNESMRWDLMNKKRIIEINEKTFRDKQKKIDILSSTFFSILLIIFIFALGSTLKMSKRTINIAISIVIIAYCLNILWIVWLQNPRWDPYTIKSFDDKCTSSGGSSGSGSSRSKSESSGRGSKSKCNLQYSCQSFGCVNNDIGADVNIDPSGNDVNMINGYDPIPLRVDSSLNAWLDGDKQDTLWTPRDIKSGSKNYLKSGRDTCPIYPGVSKENATIYKCQINNGTNTPDIIKTTIPCKYYINNERQLNAARQ